MIAGQTAPAGHPGDAAFDHPSPGDDSKALGRALGLWIGDDQALIASRTQTPHRLNVPPKMLFDPLKKLPPVMTVTPNQGKSGKASSQSLKELFSPRQVRITGRCDLGFHQVALGIHNHVPFASPDLLAHIIALLWPSNRTGFDGLAVNHSRAWLFISPLLFWGTTTIRTNLGHLLRAVL